MFYQTWCDSEPAFLQSSHCAAPFLSCKTCYTSVSSKASRPSSKLCDLLVYYNHQYFYIDDLFFLDVSDVACVFCLCTVTIGRHF